MTAHPLERDIDAEELLVGYLLQGRHCKALDRLTVTDFTAECATFFDAAERVRLAGEPVSIVTVVARLHPDVRPRLRVLADDAADVLLMHALDLVDRLERCRHRRILGRFAETLLELTGVPDTEFDSGFAALVDAGLGPWVRSLSRADIRIRRPTCVRQETRRRGMAA